MEASSFGTLVQVESRGRDDHDDDAHRLPAAPAKAVPRTYPGAPHREEASIELQRIDVVSSSKGGRQSPKGGKSPPPRTPTASGSGDDVEMSRPSSPVFVEVLQSMSDPHMNRFRLAAVCLMGLGNGLNDSAPGALIPYMEK